MTQPTILIRVLGLPFHIRAPYQAGQPINEAEAQALNALRARNIRDNFQGVVRKAKDTTGEPLSVQAMADLQEAITSYDQGYHLQQRASGRAAVDRVGREIEALAQARTEEHFRKLGLEPSDQEFDDMVLAMSALPGLVAEAQLRLEASQAIVLGSIEDLRG